MAPMKFPNECLFQMFMSHAVFVFLIVPPIFARVKDPSILYSGHLNVAKVEAP